MDPTPEQNLHLTESKAVSDRGVADQRLMSLDAYRGLIMVSLAFAGFGLESTAIRHLEGGGESRFWSHIRFQFEHVAWAGCSYWDLIQPSFMFMVGVSMAYSYVKRQMLGHTYRAMLLHAMTRAFVLILLGVFLSSNWSRMTNWAFMNVLSQIGLGYTFLFLLWQAKVWMQALTAFILLIVTWGLFVSYPGAGVDLESGSPEAGVTAQWARENLSGIAPAWHKNANVGHAIDRWFLNLFPREQKFVFNSGGYQTINFIPSLATMILGLMCGELLRSHLTSRRKLAMLLLAGCVGIGVGQLLATAGVCPLVKRLWTPSWAIYSTGWCCLILGFLYGTIDVIGWRLWAFPLYVVGLNSIAIYLMGQLLRPWVGKTLRIHFGQDLFLMLGEKWQPFVESNLIGLVFWLICYWMYRQKIFVRV